ncbi:MULTISPECIES: peptidase inhibitor family I36 protein [unclassified Streptomyces]|uniref:Peptidase inhibitor family I36 protein n=2 Tax=Streptomyces TaxID=1883 RepID=A0ABU2RSK3_9ACTN|nr:MULTISPECIES: peptidase inhibitor family I36 protein [unclassified Streptomyces]HBF84809.1 hypothetical protein [Streptomyces sp.]AEN10581.1 hypothetical protein SACTE_2698 [Streptomyces sp. SirexAA-E]MBK3594217.1 peptidase inhibitor family I36 protein [Streptomyces sp. MBT51]MDT0431810.1 peptidase inhibitor family I36 protein [Streptomyces sp. DSM 41770]MYR68860.1 hypothetical protein [Streptomyces sp. SID4939]
MNVARSLAVGIGVAALVATTAGTALASETEPVLPAGVSQEQAAADGKLDPEHLAHKAAKEAEERALGLDRSPSGSLPLVAVRKANGEVELQARTADGTLLAADYPCSSGFACLYYNSGRAGAVFRQGNDGKPLSISNYAGYTFYGTGNGSGQAVKNNAASIQNSRSGKYAVYYLSGYSGPADIALANSGRNLDFTYNENASGQPYTG